MKKSDFVEKFEDDKKNKHYVVRLLIAFDQFFNVLIWNGSQDETISSHVGRRIESGKANKAEMVICWCLRKIQVRHCIRSKGE